MFKDATSLQLFIAFFVPGFIFITIWQYFVPSGPSNWQERIPQAVGFSCVYYAVAIAPTFFLSNAQVAAYQYLMVFVIPVIVGLAYVRIRGANFHASQGIQMTPWDQFFSRVAAGEFKDGIMVHVRFKDETEIIGYFGGISYASTFPNGRELYLQRLYDFDHQGGLVKIEPAIGALVECADASFVRIARYDPVTNGRNCFRKGSPHETIPISRQPHEANAEQKGTGIGDAGLAHKGRPHETSRQD